MTRGRARPPQGTVLVSEPRRIRPTADDQVWFGLPGDLPVVQPLAHERMRGEERPAILTTDVWLEIDVGDRWRAAFRLVPYASQPVVAELRLFPRDDWPTRKAGQWRADFLGLLAGRVVGEQAGRRPHDSASFAAVRHGITGQLLRQIPVGAHVRFTRGFMADIRKRWATIYEKGPTSPFAEFLAPRAPPRAQRASGWPDRFYAELAAAYVGRLEAGSRRPIADLARRRKLSAEQIRDAIHTARERGLLTPASVQGRPGGQLTPTAKQLLRRKRR